MKIVKTKMNLEPLPGRLWSLVEPMEYRWNKHTYIVPSGFIFDGASIPRVARILIPKNGIKLYAACFHDYLYRYKILKKKEADIAFLKILLEMGQGTISAYVMYFAVKILGWYGWLQ